jgi:DNA polymerase III epsilon subunit-like protein
MTNRAPRPTSLLSAATPSWFSPGLSEEQLVVVGRDWIVIDTETTGIDPARHEVTQMAAVVLDDQCQEVANLAWQTNDGHDLMRRVIADLNPYVDAGIVVAHNLLFDLGFLTPLASPARGLLAHPPRWLCTMRLTGGTMTLAALARSQGVVLHDPHTAAGDSRTLAEVLARLVDAARNRGYSTIADIARVSPASARAPRVLRAARR